MYDQLGNLIARQDCSEILSGVTSQGVAVLRGNLFDDFANSIYVGSFPETTAYELSRVTGGEAPNVVGQTVSAAELLMGSTANLAGCGSALGSTTFGFRVDAAGI